MEPITKEELAQILKDSNLFIDAKEVVLGAETGATFSPERKQEILDIFEILPNKLANKYVNETNPVSKIEEYLKDFSKIEGEWFGKSANELRSEKLNELGNWNSKDLKKFEISALESIKNPFNFLKTSDLSDAENKYTNLMAEKEKATLVNQEKVNAEKAPTKATKNTTQTKIDSRVHKTTEEKEVSFVENTKAKETVIEKNIATSKKTKDETITKKSKNVAAEPIDSELSKLAFESSILTSGAYQNFITEISKNIELIENKAELGRSGMGTKSQQDAANAFDKNKVYQTVQQGIPTLFTMLSEELHTDGVAGFDKIDSVFDEISKETDDKKIEMLGELMASQNIEGADTLVKNLTAAKDALGNNFTFFKAFEEFDFENVKQNYEQTITTISESKESGISNENIASTLREDTFKKKAKSEEEARREAEELAGQQKGLMGGMLGKMAQAFMNMFTGGQPATQAGGLFAIVFNAVATAFGWNDANKKVEVVEDIGFSIRDRAAIHRDTEIASDLTKEFGDGVVEDILASKTKGYSETAAEAEGIKTYMKETNKLYGEAKIMHSSAIEDGTFSPEERKEIIDMVDERLLRLAKEHIDFGHGEVAEVSPKATPLNDEVDQKDNKYLS